MSDRYLLIAKAVKVTTTSPPIIVAVVHSKQKQNETASKAYRNVSVNNDLSSWVNKFVLTEFVQTFILVSFWSTSKDSIGSFRVIFEGITKQQNNNNNISNNNWQNIIVLPQSPYDHYQAASHFFYIYSKLPYSCKIV